MSDRNELPSAPPLRPPAPLAGWRRSLRLRLLVGILVWTLVTVVLAGWALSNLFHQHVEQQLHAELETHLGQLAARLAFAADGLPQIGGDLSDPRFSRPYSGLYWQVDGPEAPAAQAHRGLLRSRSLWDGLLAVPDDELADGAVHAHRGTGPDGATVVAIERVLRPAEQPDAPLRLIVAVNAARLDAPVARFNRLLAIALGVLAAGLLLAAVLQVRLGLQPLARLRAELAAVRDGRSRTLESPYPTEIQPLVNEFNGVLMRNAEVVERARTQAGNLAHAVRTPLAVLANAAAEAQGPLSQLIAEQVTLARSQVDYHLARSRAAAAVGIPGQRSALRPALEGLLRLMERVHAGRELVLELRSCPTELAFRGENQDLQEMLGNLIDNACKWARSTVAVNAHGDDASLLVTIEDDGPGLSPAARDTVFARGVRADEHMPGSGLGLAIVRDLAEMYGGDVELARSPSGGLRVLLRLPAAG